MTPTAPTPKTAIPPVEALSNPPIASNAVSSGISSMVLFVFGFVLFPNGEEELLLCLLTPKEEEEDDDDKAHLFDVEATAILAALRNNMMMFFFFLFCRLRRREEHFEYESLSVDFVVTNNCV